jgi:hypothetical protein
MRCEFTKLEYKSNIWNKSNKWNLTKPAGPQPLWPATQLGPPKPRAAHVGTVRGKQRRGGCRPIPRRRRGSWPRWAHHHTPLDETDSTRYNTTAVTRRSSPFMADAGAQRRCASHHGVRRGSGRDPCHTHLKTKWNAYSYVCPEINHT